MPAAHHIGQDGELTLLPTVLDLAAADNLHAALSSAVAQMRSLQLDASEVATLTLPCIQVILAAVKSYDVTICNPSAEFQAAFQDLALDWREHGRPSSDPEPVLSEEPAQDEPVGSDPEPVLSEEPAQDEPVGSDPEPVLSGEPAQDQPAEPIEDLDQPQEAMEDAVMKKRILTIDDSKTMRDMLMVTLADAGFDVIQGIDGQDGLATLGDARVDVVITDINMPKMDGYEVIRQLRRNPVHKTTPILVLTTESDTEKRGLAREAGATGWMVKPFDPDQLVATIRKVSP
jgi:two-component system chemotaxis response regulator CheY